MSLNIQQHVPLAPLTTLKVGGSAEYFVTVTSEAELAEALQYAEAHTLAVLVLGGGSNMLVADAGVSGLVIQMCIEGVEEVQIQEVSETQVVVTVGAGMMLDTLVALCVDRGWWGIENLSHIPGTVGATPVQNVGAYGVEVSQVIQSVRVYDTEDTFFRILTSDECYFAYRDSVFKQKKGRYVVTAVTFLFSLVPTPQLTYRDLQEYFSQQIPTQQNIREAVIEIRSKKFPDWHTVGTAGSFFKNPSVDETTALTLQKKYPELPLYPTKDGHMKVALGWILDKVLHAKGVKKGNVGLFTDQALVLIADNGATASEVEVFANQVVRDVFVHTGVVVEWEVTRVGNESATAHEQE